MIGIIGGAGPLASALLYQLVIEKAYHQGREPPELIVLNHTFPRGLSLEESATNKVRLEKELQTCLDKLRTLHVSRICISCNTLHGFLKNDEDVPLIHLPKKVMSFLHRHQMRNLALLSTETTHKLHLYNSDSIFFQKPSPEDQTVLNNIIDHILQGDLIPDDSRKIEQLIQNMNENYTLDGIVLGCSDLSVLHRRYPLQINNLPVIDSLNILAEEIILISGESI